MVTICMLLVIISVTYLYLPCIFINLEFAVFFDQSSYSVIENATIIEIVLRLSSPLQDNIMVQIIDNGSTADSK